MTVLSLLIVASKAMSDPLELFSLSVMSASTLESSRAESLVSLTASLKVSVMSEATATDVAPFTGLNVVVGLVVSAAIARSHLLSLFESLRVQVKTPFEHTQVPVKPPANRAEVVLVNISVYVFAANVDAVSILKVVVPLVPHSFANFP